MSSESPLVIKFREGPFENYFPAYLKTFGGERHADSYTYKNGKDEIEGLVLKLSDEIEMGLIRTYISQRYILDREQDNNPDYLHMVIINDGEYVQSYEDKSKNVEAESTIGVFFYDGMIPIKAEFPANIHYRSISFKFSKADLKINFQEALPLIEKMFGKENGVAYHFATPNEVTRLINDIFFFNKGGYAHKALMKARGLEVLAVILKAMEQMDDEQLNGLHQDDFLRLAAIKNKLLQSLTSSIKVEDIAQEFAISVSKLNRDFKTLFNTSIYKFYTHAKMDEAYRRLKTGEYSVSEVGYDLGYSNLSKFSDMFKKIKGINPKEVISV
ncbi:MAG: AraC family transcriptional regulator [Bacteroidales bacterium]|nr:AraC family transcriptional regulator [Bacteroidales bacterium]